MIMGQQLTQMKADFFLKVSLCKSSSSHQWVQIPYSPSWKTIWLAAAKSKSLQGRNRQRHLATQDGEEK